MVQIVTKLAYVIGVQEQPTGLALLTGGSLSRFSCIPRMRKPRSNTYYVQNDNTTMIAQSVHDGYPCSTSSQKHVCKAVSLVAFTVQSGLSSLGRRGSLVSDCVEGWDQHTFEFYLQGQISSLHYLLWWSLCLIAVYLVSQKAWCIILTTSSSELSCHKYIFNSFFTMAILGGFFGFNLLLSVT